MAVRDDALDLFSALVLVESSPACDKILAQSTNRNHLSFLSALQAAVLRASASPSHTQQHHPSNPAPLSPPPRPTISLPLDELSDAPDQPASASAPPSLRPPPPPPDPLLHSPADSPDVSSQLTDDDPTLPLIRIRLQSRSNLHPMPPQDAQQLLATTVSDRTTGAVTNDGTSVDTYDHFREALDKSMYPRSFEFFNQPVIIIAVVWVGETDVVPALAQLADPPIEQLPPAFRHGTLDMAAPTSYLLVQRASHQDDAACAPRALSSARAAFGPTGVQLIVVPDCDADPSQLPWQSKPLADMDVLAKDLTHRMVRECVEAHTYALYAHVDKVKRGVKNTFKSWFKSTEKPKNLGTNGATTFLANSVESRIRCLADGFFLLRDYEQALAHYRLVAHDFLSLGASTHYASAMEMAGICLVRMKGSRREITAAFDAAIESYLKGGLREAVVRATMRLVDFCVSNDLPDTASGVLLKGVGSLTIRGKSEGVDWFLHAAVLLHKLSICHLIHRSPRTRKSALYNFFAAERYSAAGQTHLALRCYGIIAKASKGLGMDCLEDHVNFALGRGYSQLGQSEKAFELFHQVLGETRHPASFQLELLTSMFSVNIPKNENGGNSTLLARFPVVREDSVLIETRDLVQGGLHLNQAWEELEKRLVLSNRKVAPDAARYHSVEVPFEKDLFKTSPFKQTTSHRHPGVAVAGEVLYVVFEIANPLLMAVHMVDTKALLSYEGSGDPPDAEPCPQIDLPPRSRITVRLEVHLRGPGEIKILGFVWTLRVKVYEVEHICPCEHIISRKGKRLNSTRTERCSPPSYGPDHSLHMLVAKEAPYLEAHMELGNLDDFVREGETWKGKVHIKNTGPVPVTDLKVISGNPSSLFCPGPETDPNVPICVAAKSVLELSCWLRAPSTGGKPGSVTLHVLLGYSCPTRGNNEPKWRLCRVSSALEVQPCLVAFPRFLRNNAMATARRSKDYLLGIEVEHAWTEGEETYEIYSLGTLASSSWHTRSLREAAIPESPSTDVTPFDLSLRVNETATVFVIVSETYEKHSPRKSQFVRLAVGNASADVEEKDDMGSRVREQFFSAEQRANLPVDPRSLWVAIFWREVSSGAVGELYLPSLIPSEWVDDGNESPVPTQIAMQDLGDGPVLEVSVEVEAVVEFTASGLPLVVPVTVHVYNRSDFVMDARIIASPSGIADESRGRSWCGDTSVRVRHLAPDATRSLSLSIVVNGPGVYNVSDIIVEPVKSKMGSGYVHNSARPFARIEECRLRVVAAPSSGRKGGGRKGDGEDAVLGSSDWS